MSGRRRLLFNQGWWLDAVAPGSWGETTVERGGNVVARLPWAIERLPMPVLRLSRVGTPRLTPALEPELELGDGKPEKRMARELELLGELYDALPRHDYLRYHFPARFTNWLPFAWKGCQATTRVTYVLDDLTDLDAVWRGMHENTRNTIRKAEREVEVAVDESTDRLAAALRATYARQGRGLPFDEALLQRVHGACRAREAGRVLTAVDASGRVHGSLILVWDADRAYYLAAGADPELRSSGAQSLLVWEAIRRAAETSREFDFEGSMIQGVARFFGRFGSRPETYLQVTGTSRRLRIGLALKDLGTAVAGR